MSGFSDYTVPQLLEAALGELDLVRGNAALVSTLEDCLIRAAAALSEIGRRMQTYEGVRIYG